jgi:ribosomal-protein-serine acetyltransferase
MLIATRLTDGVLILHPLGREDAQPMYEAVCESLPELKPWMAWAHENYTRGEADDWVGLAQARWAEAAYFGFAITEASTGVFLGSCSLSHFHPVYHFCNLGYWIRSSRRGHGFAGRAARLAARFAFERLGLVRVEIVIATDNAASQRVAEKIGAHREGLLHNRMVLSTEVHDALMYSLLPADFGLTARL